MTHAKRSILYVWDADYPWDVRTEKVTLALTRAGHVVNIVARNKAWRPTTEILPEATVHRMPPWKIVGQRIDKQLGFPAFFSPRWSRLIARTARDARADVIIVRDLPLCPTAIAVGKRSGIPVVLDMAENYPAMMRVLWETGRNTWLDYFVRNPSLAARLERWCVRQVDHIIVVVEESADRVAALEVPRSKLTVVSNTPPLARLDSGDFATCAPHDDINVVYMGNLEVVRGLIESVDAIARLKSKGVRVRLHVIGRGRDEALIKQRCSEQGLGSDDVEFLGYIESHQEALAIVSGSDVGLMPHRKNESWDTTIPNKLFDYMAAGLPVVSSNATPCERILNETGAGRTFVSGDSASIARAIEAVTEPGVRAAMGTAGRIAVKKRYNWEHDTEVLLDVIESIKKPQKSELNL